MHSHCGKGLSKCGPGASWSPLQSRSDHSCEGPLALLNHSRKTEPSRSEFQGGLACHPPGSVWDKGPHNQVEHAPKDCSPQTQGKELGGENPRSRLCRYFLMHPQAPGSNLHPPGEKPSGQETEAQGLVPLSELLEGSGSPQDHTLSGVPDLETSLEAARDRKQH